VVLDLDGEPLVMWVEGRPFGNSPGFEDTVQLQPQVVVQSRGIVLLDDEAPAVRRCDMCLAARLLRLPEIALVPVGR